MLSFFVSFCFVLLVCYCSFASFVVTVAVVIDVLALFVVGFLLPLFLLFLLGFVAAVAVAVWEVSVCVCWFCFFFNPITGSRARTPPVFNSLKCAPEDEMQQHEGRPRIKLQ